MSQCPVCMAAVPDDFGLIECASCGAQLLVHMDGKVEHSGAKVDHAVEDAPPPLPDAEPEGPFAFGFPHTEMDEQLLEQINEPTVLGGAPPGDDDLTQAPVEPLEPPEPPPPLPPPEEFQFADAPPDVIPEVISVTPPHDAASADLSDIARFGNSSASGGQDGSLRYNLFVTGIDSTDVREAFREAITDRRLVWDIDQILRSVKNGEVRIAAVTPAKAFLVVSRLRSLPVQIRWEQYAVSQS